MSDTSPVSLLRPVATCLAVVLAGCAAPLAQGPRVVWVRENRAYVVLPDSTALASGDRVRFQRGAKTLANGTVTQVERGEMAQVTLTSGTLGVERDLARTTVLRERSPLTAPAVLRLGLPSAARGTAFFACAHGGVAASWPADAYRTDSSSPRVARFIRNPAISGGAPLPDTLVVRFYDESTDEEIAIERGELDAALFWPGELSSHMRTSPRWRDPLMGVRSLGAVALMWSDSSAVDLAAVESAKGTIFAGLNRDLFSGDLLLLPFDPDSTRPSHDRPRFQVDPGCPGRAELQRYLDRHAPAPSRGLVRLRYGETFIRPEPGSFQIGESTGTSLYAIRCPIVCAPELRAYLSAFGVNRLADLIACTP